ncbi:MAG: CRISPR-associated endonuclease Cas2 [Candidatus Aenigmatarchaeota archaeon]
MLYWVIYDISNNGIRAKVASKCKNYGLRRVQKSAFIGELTKNRAEMLAMEVESILGDSDAVFVMPSCEECFGGKIVSGDFDEDGIRKKDFVIVGGSNEG